MFIELLLSCIPYLGLACSGIIFVWLESNFLTDIIRLWITHDKATRWKANSTLHLLHIESHLLSLQSACSFFFLRLFESSPIWPKTPPKNGNENMLHWFTRQRNNEMEGGQALTISSVCCLYNVLRCWQLTLSAFSKGGAECWVTSPGCEQKQARDILLIC